MTQFTQGHALIIGVGADLPNTVDDADSLAAILKDPARCAYPPGQVQTLTGPDATRAAILDGLQALKDRCDSESTAVIYFSGHGYEVNGGYGKQYFLMPYGYSTQDLPGTAVSGQELSAALRAIPARKLLLLLDCCHAGGLDDIKNVTLTKAPIPGAAIEELAGGSGRALIASSRASELSYAGKPFSAFTRALLEALCGRGASQEDGFARMGDIAMHAAKRVPELTRDKQHPVLNFEESDNFKVAYYAAGEKTPKALPFPEEPDIEPEPGAYRGVTINITKTYQATADRGGVVAQDHSTAVGSRGVLNTGKVGGHIVTGDGNTVAGRDANMGLTAAELESLFASILTAIAAQPAGQRAEAIIKVQELKSELDKGEKADDSRLARLIDGLVSIAPGTAAGLVAAFAHPVLAGLAGPATQAILTSLQ